MKKILWMVSLLIAMMGFCTALAQEKPNEVIFTKGQIAEVGSDTVRVVGQGAHREIVLDVTASTHIVSAEDGRTLDFAGLQKGEKVVAYYGPQVRKSMPPQASAIALVVGTPTSGGIGMYMQVATVQKKSDGNIRALSTNGDMLITIRKEIFPQHNNVREGSELIVWYNMMTMSMPGQATAIKAVLLPAQIKVHLGNGVIFANGKELPLDEGDNILVSGEKIMLPLRVIMENLGYDLLWDGERQQVRVLSGAHIAAAFRIGSTSYQKGQELIELADAPVVINGKTLMPVEFFSDVLSMKVQIINS